MSCSFNPQNSTIPLGKTILGLSDSFGTFSSSSLSLTMCSNKKMSFFSFLTRKLPLESSIRGSPSWTLSSSYNFPRLPFSWGPTSFGGDGCWYALAALEACRGSANLAKFAKFVWASCGKWLGHIWKFDLMMFLSHTILKVFSLGLREANLPQKLAFFPMAPQILQPPSKVQMT